MPKSKLDLLGSQSHLGNQSGPFQQQPPFSRLSYFHRQVAPFLSSLPLPQHCAPPGDATRLAIRSRERAPFVQPSGWVVLHARCGMMLVSQDPRPFPALLVLRSPHITSFQ